VVRSRVQIVRSMTLAATALAIAGCASDAKTKEPESKQWPTAKWPAASSAQADDLGVRLPTEREISPVQTQTEQVNAILEQHGEMASRLKDFSTPPVAWEPPPAPAPTHRPRTPVAEAAVQAVAPPAAPTPVIPPPSAVLAAPSPAPDRGALPAWPDTLGRGATNAPASLPIPPATTESHSLAEVLSRTLRAQLDKSSGGKPIAVALSEGALSIAEPDRRFDAAQYPALTAEERQVVTKFHAACVTLGRDLLAGKSTSELAGAIGSLAATLEPEPTLTVSRAEFATKVDGFGRLNVIDQRRFLPGRSTQVIVYSEIQGFSSSAAGERGTSMANGSANGFGWVTTLATKVSILAKHDGTEVWTRDWQAVSDTSDVRRSEFFICEKITLSELLTVGTYLMKTTVRDDVSGAVAEKSIEFSIVADPALAGR